jgi:hypothetical protein
MLGQMTDPLGLSLCHYETLPPISAFATFLVMFLSGEKHPNHRPHHEPQFEPHPPHPYSLVTAIQKWPFQSLFKISAFCQSKNFSRRYLA